jgi:hypothetical protein
VPAAMPTPTPPPAPRARAASAWTPPAACGKCQACVDRKDRGCAPCWVPDGCLWGAFGRDVITSRDCRVCWASAHRCPWMCGAASVCAQRCGPASGCADAARKGDAACRPCWTRDAEMQAQIAGDIVADIVAKTGAKPAELARLQCLGSPTGEDCSYCWVHHHATRMKTEL